MKQPLCKISHSIFKGLTIILLFYYFLMSIIYNIIMVYTPREDLIGDIDTMRGLYANMLELLNFLVIIGIIWGVIFVIKLFEKPEHVIHTVIKLNEEGEIVYETRETKDC